MSISPNDELLGFIENLSKIGWRYTDEQHGFSTALELIRTKALAIHEKNISIPKNLNSKTVRCHYNEKFPSNCTCITCNEEKNCCDCKFEEMCCAPYERPEPIKEKNNPLLNKFKAQLNVKGPSEPKSRLKIIFWMISVYWIITLIFDLIRKLEM